MPIAVAMDDLEDELDLRFHRGVKPDVYYRIPTSESLHGALQGELERNTSRLIPSDIVTEFVFATASTVTIPVTEQASLDALIEPQDYAQSIQVEYALCREVDGRDRLNMQRAISKSIIAAIEEADGFKYIERHAYNPKVGGDGARFRYDCQDSLDSKNHKAKKKKKELAAEDKDEVITTDKALIPAYDCGGVVHVRFSIKRDAINVVYRHNPVHRDAESRHCDGDDSANLEANGSSTPRVAKTPNGTASKRKRSKKDVAVDDENQDPGLDMPTSPGAPRDATKKKKKRKSDGANTTSTTKLSKKKGKVSQTASASSPSNSRKQAAPKEVTMPRRLGRNKACIRCREKKIKCNEAYPTCNQCNRGLWTCQYETVRRKQSQRSRNDCLNCKQRRRKCTEEKPSCAFCLKIDDHCEYTV